MISESLILVRDTLIEIQLCSAATANKLNLGKTKKFRPSLPCYRQRTKVVSEAKRSLDGISLKIEFLSRPVDRDVDDMWELHHELFVTVYFALFLSLISGEPFVVCLTLSASAISEAQEELKIVLILNV